MRDDAQVRRCSWQDFGSVGELRRWGNAGRFPFVLLIFASSATHQMLRIESGRSITPIYVYQHVWSNDREVISRLKPLAIDDRLHMMQIFSFEQCSFPNYTPTHTMMLAQLAK